MLLQLKNISFTFSGKNYLLNNISLSLEEGKIYALMGGNGSGKTTLFNLISGFIRPLTGEVLFSSQNITNMAPYIINRKGITRTFQDLRLITKLTVKENLILAMQNNPSDNWLNALLPRKFHRNTNEKFEKLANEISGQFFLEDVRNSLAGEISYGQQKLLNLACCVANGGKLLLLDEPVAGINPEYSKKMEMLLTKLTENKMTILLIEHHTDFIKDIANEIFFLKEGSIYQYDSIEKLRIDPIVLEAYL